MSNWAHITACLSVETGLIMKRNELKNQVRVDMKEAPKITGSEADASIYVNVQEGHNFSTSHDCERCKYADTLKTIKDDEDGRDYQICDGPTNHKCSAEYQTCVVISVQGDLRDKTIKETEEDFARFLEYVNEKYHIRDYSVHVEGDY